MTAPRLWWITACVVLALLASLAFSALRLGWHMEGHTSVLPLPVAQSQTAQSTEPLADIKTIIAFAPFGNAVLTAKPASASKSAVPLDIALRGVLVDPDPQQSRAFVLAKGATATFRIGDMIEAAELVAINADTITLRAGDTLQVVGFAGAEDTPEVESVDATEENPTDPFARLAAAIVPGKGSIDLREAPPPETTDEYINLWRDRIAQNPQAAMDTVGVEQVENGYRIKANPNIGVTLAGLRPGDVVTRLNGQQVGDLDSDRQLYDDVAASGIARLEVVRDGQALLLTFPLR